MLRGTAVWGRSRATAKGRVIRGDKLDESLDLGLPPAGQQNKCQLSKQPSLWCLVQPPKGPAHKRVHVYIPGAWGFAGL